MSTLHLNVMKLTYLVQIINPQSFRPVFKYNLGLLHAHDLYDLLDEGYLHAIGKCGLWVSAPTYQAISAKPRWVSRRVG